MNYIAQSSQPDFENTVTNTQSELNLPNPNSDSISGGMVVFFAIFYLIIIALSIFDMVFRVKAMWRAARLSDKGWFICLFLFNTVGILPIIYLRKNKDRYREIILKNHSD